MKETNKNADYTILTPEQRTKIREALKELGNAIVKAKPNKAIDIFFTHQATVGEKFKSFEDKMEYINNQINVFKAYTPQVQPKATSKYWVLFIDADTMRMSMRNMYNKPTKTQKEIFMAITDEVSAATICNRYNNEIAFSK